MRTGNEKMRVEAQAIGLRFEKDRLIVQFDDEREVSVPLSHYPTLQRARPSERAAWEMIGPRRGFHWESLDLDLSVQGLISGLPEMIPAPPPRPRKRRTAGKALVR